MMFFLSICWFAWTLFVAGLGVTAIADTGRTWGPAQAFGLTAGLLALYFWVPLGSLFTLGAAVGALTLARGEKKRLALEG